MGFHVIWQKKTQTDIFYAPDTLVFYILENTSLRSYQNALFNTTAKS